MNITSIVTGPLEENAWLLPLKGGRVAIIDPGADAENIIAEISRLGLKPCVILLTHGHFDHIGAIPGLLQEYPGIPVAIHKGDALSLGKGAASFHGVPPGRDSWVLHLPEASFFLEEGPAPEIPGEGNILEGWEIIHTPGHTKGSVCIYNKEERLLFSGDTLFYGDFGRTDLAGGNPKEMRESLKRLYELEGETVVMPGHYQTTTIERERRYQTGLA